MTVQEIQSMGKWTITGNITMTPSECETLKAYAVNGIAAKADNGRLREQLRSAQWDAGIWKRRYETLYEKISGTETESPALPGCSGDRIPAGKGFS